MLPVRVQYRPLLVSGMLAVDDAGYIILIDSEQSQREQRIALAHEYLHWVDLSTGLPLWSEDEVEALAIELTNNGRNEWPK